ncbi:hypothetical protein EI534_18860 [Pseudomonas frederiksbergensis]|nr:hypothetical protein [Pseudomonas frederiksbergensis]
MNDLVNPTQHHLSANQLAGRPVPRFQATIEIVRTLSGRDVDNGDAISETELTLIGVGPINEKLRVFDGAVELLSARIDERGLFSVLIENLEYAIHRFTIVTENGQRSDPYVVQIKKADVTISDVLDSMDRQVGNGGVTHDPLLRFFGRAAPGTNVQLFDNGAMAAIIHVGAGGGWKTQLALQHGHMTGWHQYRAVAPDGQSSDTWDIYVYARQFTVIESVKGSQGNDVPNGSTIYGNALSFFGRSSPDQTLELFDNDQRLQATRVDAYGQWSIREEKLSPGTHKFKAITETGVSLLWVVYVKQKQVPQIDSVTDDEGNPVENGGSTSGGTLTLQGHAFPGDGGTLVDYSGSLKEFIVKPSGCWLVQLTGLRVGLHTFRVVMDDGLTSYPWVVRVIG